LEKLVSWLGDWRENSPRVRQAVKTTIAACAAFLIADMLDLPQSFWAAVVAIMVTQASIGASIGHAIDQFLGSLVGAFTGAVVAVLVGNSSTAVQVLGLAGTVLVLGYFAAAWVQMRIACVNAAIIILAQPALGPPLTSASIRVTEVVIGTVVAIVTMLLVLPSRAGPALAEHVARTLPLYFGLLSDLLNAALTGRYDREAIVGTNAKIRAAVGTNEVLRSQTQTEVAGFLADTPDPEPLLTSLRRLWHTELMLARSVASPLPATALEVLRPGIEELRDAVEGLRVQSGKYATNTRGHIRDTSDVQAAIAKLSALMVRLRETKVLAALPMDDAMRVMTFDFALEQLRQNLKDLANRNKDLALFAGVSVPAAAVRKQPSD
jgi:uncharacterized membrane protein YccC